MIAKLAGVVPKVTLSNPFGLVSPVPGKTESLAEAKPNPDYMLQLQGHHRRRM